MDKHAKHFSVCKKIFFFLVGFFGALIAWNVILGLSTVLIIILGQQIDDFISQNTFFHTMVVKIVFPIIFSIILGAFIFLPYRIMRKKYGYHFIARGWLWGGILLFMVYFAVLLVAIF